MTEALVECVPNFSEGRDRAKIDRIVQAADGIEGVRVLDVDPGFETNRTVVTLVGPPAGIEEAAFRLIARAAEVIDMSRHQGAHPRHGATDVCPFVPISGVTMDDCVEIAKRVGERVGRELRIPVYLYDQAAQSPKRRSLAEVRKGEYEALPEKLADPEWLPDYGPAEFNPKTGVVTIGAREFLIAYNVNLNSTDKAHADDIAFEIREKGRAVRRDQRNAFYSSGTLVKYHPSRNEWPCGECLTVFESRDALSNHMREAHDLDLMEELKFFGRDPDRLEGVNVMKRGRFRECRAVGWVIPEYGRAQISINLTNFRITPAHEVLEACRELAADRGLVVTGSEVVGLIPYEALHASGRYYLERRGSSLGVPRGDVVECAVQSLGLRDVSDFDVEQRVLGLPSSAGALASMRVVDLVHEVSRATPAPGGGSIAALAGALCAALGSMVANLTHGKQKLHDVHDRAGAIACSLQELLERLLAAIDADTDAFNDVLAAMRLPHSNAEESAARSAAIEQGYKSATMVPLGTAENALSAMRLCRDVAEIGLAASVTDAGVGALMGHAAVLGAIDNVRINLTSIEDATWVAEIRTRLAAMTSEAEELLAKTRAIVDSRLV